MLSPPSAKAEWVPVFSCFPVFIQSRTPPQGMVDRLKVEFPVSISNPDNPTQACPEANLI